MSLVVVGNHELNELEDMVRKYFAQIVNKERKLDDYS